MTSTFPGRTEHTYVAQHMPKGRQKVVDNDLNEPSIKN